MIRVSLRLTFIGPMSLRSYLSAQQHSELRVLVPMQTLSDGTLKPFSGWQRLGRICLQSWAVQVSWYALLDWSTNPHTLASTHLRTFPVQPLCLLSTCPHPFQAALTSSPPLQLCLVVGSCPARSSLPLVSNPRCFCHISMAAVRWCPDGGTAQVPRQHRSSTTVAPESRQSCCRLSFICFHLKPSIHQRWSGTGGFPAKVELLASEV